MDTLRQQKANRKRGAGAGAREVPESAAPQVSRAAPPPPPVVTTTARPAPTLVPAPAPAPEPVPEPGSPDAVPDGGTGFAPLDRIWHRPDNPRDEEEYDQERDEALKAMGDTFDGFGQLQAGTFISRTAWVKHNPEHDEVIPEYIWWIAHMGNKRFELAQAKGLEGMPFLRNDSLADPVKAMEAGLIENFHRTSLHPIREARELQRLLEAKGTSARALAPVIGYRPMAISRSLQLLKLIPEFQEIVVRGKASEGELSVDKALALALLPPREQQELLELGWPYSPARLRKPVEPGKPDTEQAAKVTRARVSIPQGSDPEGIVKHLTAGIDDPDLLNDVVLLLSQAARRAYDQHAESAGAEANGRGSKTA